MNKSFVAVIYITLILNFSCHKKNSEQLFELVDPSDCGIDFNNKIIENDTFNVLDFMNIYTGGGVATGDVNNDGLPDLYFSGNMVSSRLYINKSTKEKLYFEDVTESAGVGTDQWITGVTMVDVNQDGLLDIYACSSGSKKAKNKANKLFINQGIINGIPTFKDLAEEYGLQDTSYSTQAVFFDYDKDSDLDVFLIVNYAEIYGSNSVNFPKKILKKYDPDRSPKLYRNNSVENAREAAVQQRMFVEVSEKAGITEVGYGLGISISDINNDNWPDVYITNDFLSNDILYINNQDGTFTNKISEYLKYSSYAGMGVDVADYNNDQLPDIAVVDMMPEDNFRLKAMRVSPNYFRLMNEIRNGYAPQFSRNTLQLNNGKNIYNQFSFSEIGQLANFHHTDWSWSVLFADFDNDGNKDLFVSNGFRRDLQDLDFIKYSSSMGINRENILKTIKDLPGVKVSNYLFKNNGDLALQNVTKEWGMQKDSYSNGATYVDLDNDGDLDMIVNNVDDPAFVYKNLSSEKPSRNHYVKVNFAGPTNNKDGIGAKIELTTKENTQLYENYTVRGFQSCINTSVVAGVGQNKIIQKLKVLWPDGKQQILENFKVDTTLLVDYNNAVFTESTEEKTFSTTFRKDNNILSYKNHEFDYIDFNDQITLPFKLSENGPGIAVGDVDGNGTEDLYICGSNGLPGVLQLQDKNGKFSIKQIHEDKNFEDQGALLFDADQDGDNDLYVVSGSVERGVDSEFYQDRLYINDGKGNFTISKQSLPLFNISGSCVTASDFDKDGDLDLFVGGRVLPLNYPLPTSSKILLNVSKEKDKPLFKDVTTELLPALNQVGMVISSLWTDFNNDSWMDLMIAGEGMEITLFENQQGKFAKTPIKIPQSKGHWNSILSSDFDQDGDVDYVLGNLGYNTQLKPSVKEPVTVYGKDFDFNGKMDPVVFYYLQGKKVPFHPRDEVMEQVVKFRKKYIFYHDYAAVTFDNFFTKEDLQGAYELKFENFSTSYLENRGNGSFKLTALPIEAQFGPVKGVLADDYDHDGFPDLLIVGNTYASNIIIGWCDASIGRMFKGYGDGSFKSIPHQTSGFFSDKDTKSMVEVISDQNVNILITKTRDSLEVFSYPVRNMSIIPIKPNDSWAEIKFKNGKAERRELHYGSGYLSQSSRHIKVTDKVAQVKIYNYAGEMRLVDFSQLTIK